MCWWTQVCAKTDVSYFELTDGRKQAGAKDSQLSILFAQAKLHSEKVALQKDDNVMFTSWTPHPKEVPVLSHRPKVHPESSPGHPA